MGTRTKVTDKMIEKMNDLYASGYNYNRIASLMGLSNPTVQSYIKTGTAYPSGHKKKTSRIGGLKLSTTSMNYNYSTPEELTTKTVLRDPTAKELADAITLVKRYFKVEI